MAYKVSGSADLTALAGGSRHFGISPPDKATVSEYAASRSGPMAQYGSTLIAFLRHPTMGPPKAFDVEASS